MRALKPYRVFPQDPRQTGRCWQQQSHISLQHLSPVTTSVSGYQNRDHVMDSERDSTKFDAFYVISRHKTRGPFFFLQRNPSMRTLAGLCINFIKIPLISPSGKRSKVHPHCQQRQTRCFSEKNNWCAWPLRSPHPHMTHFLLGRVNHIPPYPVNIHQLGRKRTGAVASLSGTYC